MKKSLYAFFALSLALTACQSAPQMLPPVATTPMLRANAPQSAPISAQYSFRKPVASLFLDFYSSTDRSQGLDIFKEFVRKYLDDNDIFNYQIVEQNGGKDIVTINIFGGNKETVSKKILPDALYYLKQRVRFDNYGISTP